MNDTAPRPVPDRIRVLFIGGSGRSGSTLVDRMVGAVPGACSLGEVVHLWQRALVDDELCGCGMAFSACPFWQAVGVEAFGGWDQVDARAVLALKARVDRTRHIGLLGAPWRPARFDADLTAYVDYYERIYAAAGRVAGAEVVVDSSKHPSLAFCLSRSRRLALTIAHVVRDSPGVAYSWSKSVRRPEAEESWMPTYSTRRAITDWLSNNGLFTLLGRRVDTRLVRYEDLAAHPVDTLRDLVRHLGLRASDDDLAFVSADRVTLAAAHGVAGNPMRFTVGVIPVRQDDEWRTQLPTRRRQAVMAATLPLRWRYGYLRAAKR